jgi:hypothetical protein
MARRSVSEFRKESTREPFKVELSNGSVVTFRDPSKIPFMSSLELSQETDALQRLRFLLSPEDYKLFEEELKTLPVDEASDLIVAAMEHYGSDADKS